MNMTESAPMPVVARSCAAPIFYARCAVALVWLYHGLWCKLLGRSATQAAVVAGVPLLSGPAARTALLAIGAGEVLLAGWVLSGRRRRAAAIVQTAAIVAMNVGGLLWSRASIHDPAGMIVHNLALIALIWCVAIGGVHRRENG